MMPSGSCQDNFYPALSENASGDDSLKPVVSILHAGMSQRNNPFASFSPTLQCYNPPHASTETFWLKDTTN